MASRLPEAYEARDRAIVEAVFEHGGDCEAAAAAAGVPLPAVYRALKRPGAHRHVLDELRGRANALAVRALAVHEQLMREGKSEAQRGRSADSVLDRVAPRMQQIGVRVEGAVTFNLNLTPASEGSGAAVIDGQLVESVGIPRDTAPVLEAAAGPDLGSE